MSEQIDLFKAPTLGVLPDKRGPGIFPHRTPEQIRDALRRWNLRFHCARDDHQIERGRCVWCGRR